MPLKKADKLKIPSNNNLARHGLEAAFDLPSFDIELPRYARNAKIFFGAWMRLLHFFAERPRSAATVLGAEPAQQDL